MNNKNFKINKSKILYSLFGSILFFFISFYLIINPEKYTNFFIHNPFYIRITAVIGFVFFGLGVCVFIYIIFLKKVGVIINQNGIYSNITLPKYGIIKWEEIKSIKIVSEKVDLPFIGMKEKEIKNINIEIKNPIQFIRSKTNINRLLLKILYQKSKSPIVLNSTLLYCTFEDLEKAIMEGWKEYKKEKLKEK